MERVGGCEAAHAGTVRDVDLAHCANHLLASGGDDGCVRYWDLRCLCRSTVI